MKIKILVHNSTGAEKRPGELCLASGIIKYDSNNEYAHISSINGKTVYEVVEVVAPKIEEIKLVSTSRSTKKKSSK